MTIGQRLREERERLKLTQPQFAALGGVEKGAQIRYESGKGSPSANHLAAAAEQGLDVLYVITGRREPGPNTKTFSYLPTTAPHTTVRETPPKWGDADAKHHPPVRPDTTHTGGPPTGGCAVGGGGGLLSLADASTAPPLRLPIAFNGGQTTREFQVIPRFRATASAGKTGARQVGADDLQVDAAGVLAMDRTFMRAELGSDKAGFITVKIQGDSMERTLIDGETIIIDSDVTEVSASGIYVVQVGRNLLVKRLVLRMDGGLLVKSDNPAYAAGDAEYSAEQADALRVVGRMVWPKFR